METLDSKTLVSKWIDLQLKRQANPEKYRPRSTGLRALDKVLGGGVEFGNLVIYGGKQKVGKSTMLQHTATHFGRNKDPFAFFSIEMTNNAIATRVLCDMSGVEKDRIRRIEWSETEWDRILTEADTVAKFEAWWSYGVYTLVGIQKVIEDLRKKEGKLVNSIFVDYVQLMDHPGKSVRREELEGISRAFKRMSVELDEPMLVFLAAQVNREAAKSHVVSANQFFGSGAFERDMDIGIIIHEIKDENTGEVRTDARQLTVVGSRDTGVGSVPIRFNGSTSSIRDMEAEDNEISLNFWTEQATA